MWSAFHYSHIYFRGYFTTTPWGVGVKAELPTMLVINTDINMRFNHPYYLILTSTWHLIIPTTFNNPFNITNRIPDR